MRFPRSQHPTAALALFVGLTYFMLSVAGLQVGEGDLAGTILWPAGGFGMAALIIGGRRRWLPFTAAIVVGNLLANSLIGEFDASSAGLAAANGLEALLAAAIARWAYTRMPTSWGEIRDFLALAAAATAAAGASSLVAATSLSGAGGPSFASAALHWWAADALGILVVAPLLLSLRGGNRRRASRPESLAAVTMVGVLTGLTFLSPTDGAPVIFHWPFLLFPALMWTALRAGKREVVMSLGLLAAAASYGTAHGLGPFVEPGIGTTASLLVAQVFLATMLVCTLLVSAITARRDSADRALRDERERFVSVLRAATEFSVIATDLDGVITLFNDGSTRMLGYSSEEVVGRTTPALFHDPSEVAARAADLGIDPGFEVFVHAARAGTPETREWTYLTKHGESVIVSLTVTAITDADGAVTGFMGIAQDISERRAGEHRLRKEQENQRLMLQHLPDTMVSLYDEHLICVRTEGHLLTRLGYRPEQFIGKPLAGTVPQAQYEAVLPAVRRALDGSVGTVEMTSSLGVALAVDVAPVLDEHGTVTHVMLVSRDVTAARLAEAERLVAEERFRGAFENAPVGMAVVALDGTVERVNKALVALTGYDTHELAERTLDGCSHLADLEDEHEGRRWLLEGHLEVWAGERRLVHRTGHTISCAVHTTLMHDAAGAPTHFLTHLIDVTERKLFERQLQHMADHDPLTGLVNRRRFEEELSGHMADVSTGHVTGALILIDVDHFKQVNDTLGHAVGDALLIAVSDELRSRLRGADLVARLGGDEFAVLLRDVNPDGAARVAQLLVEQVRQSERIEAVAEDIRITLSVGVAMCDALGTGDDVTRAADLAMYEAKRGGRDQYAVAQAVSPTRELERRT